MAPPLARKLSLPASLLKEIGAQAPEGGKDFSNGGHRNPAPRKERRKAERLQKRSHRSNTMRPRKPARPLAPGGQGGNTNGSRPRDRGGGRPAAREISRDESEQDSEDDEDFDQEEDESEEDVSGRPAVSRVDRDKLSRDDAEIAELERKLGMKGGKSLPQAFRDDGLGDILGDLGEQDEDVRESKKRKAEADEWLAEKRRKSLGRRTSDGQGAASEGGETDDDESLDLDLDDDGASGGGWSGVDQDEEFAGFDSDPEPDVPRPKRVRENPYVAPMTGAGVAKYVPPSRRTEPSGSDAELVLRLRRQLQGLVNRITDSNMVSIVGDIEKVYREQPRQHTTSVLADLILGQVCDPTSLPDTLLILSAGFSTAVFKVIGVDFGAQLVQEAVDRFDRHYERISSSAAAGSGATKETSNLITFLAELYNFRLIGCNLIFDYVRILLEDLSELNAELLLRIIRLCGTSLRQDDPSSLKDIVALIRPAVARLGEGNVSVRTKFMIETIDDLKNNRMKTGVNASAVLTEHTVRMKKLLGSLNTRKLQAAEPLRIGLRDIRDSDKRGKWWLVGASWSGKPGSEAGREKKAEEGGRKQGSDADSEDDDILLLDGEDGGMPDLVELAREQMMNTDVRRSIFVAIMSASDYQDAHQRLLKLRLNKDRQREMANVIIQCAGAEQQHNPYYTLIAKRLCADRKIRWSFQDALWKLFRRMGEPIFGDEADEVDDDDESIETRRLVNVAKMYGALVRDGALGLGVLKCLDLPYLQPRARAFVEVLLITAMLECGTDEAAVAKVFGGGLAGTPELCRSLQWFVRKVIRKSDLAGGKKASKKLKAICAMADRTLGTAQIAGTVEGE